MLYKALSIAHCLFTSWHDYEVAQFLVVQSKYLSIQIKSSDEEVEKSLKSNLGIDQEDLGFMKDECTLEK